MAQTHRKKRQPLWLWWDTLCSDPQGWWLTGNPDDVLKALLIGEVCLYRLFVCLFCRLEVWTCPKWRCSTCPKSPWRMQESTPAWQEIPLDLPISLPGSLSSQVKNKLSAWFSAGKIWTSDIKNNFLLQRRKQQMLWTPWRPSTLTSSSTSAASWLWSWPPSSWCYVECRCIPEGSRLTPSLSRSSPSFLFEDRYGALCIMGILSHSLAFASSDSKLGCCWRQILPFWILSVLSGVELVRKVQRITDEGGSPLIQLLPHAGWSHGVWIALWPRLGVP